MLQESMADGGRWVWQPEPRRQLLHNNLHHYRIRLGIRDGRSLTGNREHHHLL
jgi:hypothetical protein